MTRRPVTFDATMGALFDSLCSQRSLLLIIDGRCYVMLIYTLIIDSNLSDVGSTTRIRQRGPATSRSMVEPACNPSKFHTDKRVASVGKAKVINEVRSVPALGFYGCFSPCGVKCKGQSRRPGSCKSADHTRHSSTHPAFGFDLHFPNTAKSRRIVPAVWSKRLFSRSLASSRLCGAQPGSGSPLIRTEDRGEDMRHSLVRLTPQPQHAMESVLQAASIR